MTKSSTTSHKTLIRLAFSALQLSIAAAFVTGCGSVTSDTKFRIRFLGSLSQPTGATGSQSPISQIYLFENLSLQPDDGSAAVSLYSGDPVELRVIARAQEVWSTTDLTDLTGKGFTSATVSFDPTVVVVDQDGTNHNITLDTGDLVMSEPFSITTGDETVVTIRASWGKTITPSDGDTVPVTTVSAPSFELFLGESQ